jgi:hypothetical protein
MPKTTRVFGHLPAAGRRPRAGSISLLFGQTPQRCQGFRSCKTYRAAERQGRRKILQDPANAETSCNKRKQHEKRWNCVRQRAFLEQNDGAIMGGKCMSATGLDVFDKTLQTTNIWLDEIMAKLGPDRQVAWLAYGRSTSRTPRR